MDIKLREQVRAIGGLLSIVTLLVLLGAHVLIDGATLSVEYMRTLIILIGALLGIDILFEFIPVKIAHDGTITDDRDNDR